MSTEAFLAGHRFRLYRRATGADVFMCLAITKSLQRGNNYEETSAYNCDNPSELPWRKSVKTGRFWNLSFSGKLSAARLSLLQADVDSEDPVEYRLTVDPADGQGAGNWTGSIHFENLEIGSNENGMVTFAVTARGDDALAWNAAA